MSPPAAVDHCTLWPDRIGGADWSACCAAHDAAYGAGLDKLGADLTLAHCVAAVAGWPMGLLVLTGVTLGGWAFFRRRPRIPSDPSDPDRRERPF